MEELVKYLKALVYIQANRASESEPVKLEILLHRAGLRPKEIAEALGKNEGAIAKAITRARPKVQRGIARA